jgi:hypothetical protein
VKRGPLLAAVALVLLVALLTALFLAGFERVEETVEIPAIGEARTNNFFALERFYGEMGIEARDVIGWNRLPPTDHTLMLLGARYTEEDLRTNALIDWVERGGHLVMVPQGAIDVALDHRECDVAEEESYADDQEFYGDEAPTPEQNGEDITSDDLDSIEDELEELGYSFGQGEGDEASFGDGNTPGWAGYDEDGDLIDEPILDPLAVAFGIEVEIPPHAAWDALWACDDPSEEGAGQGSDGGDESNEKADGDPGCEIENTWVETATGGYRTGLLPLPGIRESRASAEGSSQQDAAAFRPWLRIERGLGTVTAIVGSDFLTNRQIGNHDHAALAWDLVMLPDHSPAGIWIVGRDRYPGLLEVLREHAWRILVSGLLVLLVALWWKGVRFGPPVPDVVPERRSVVEHISASADFLWRSRLGTVLLASARRAALARFELREPGFAELGDNERVERLSAASGLSRGQLLRALSDHGADDPTEFTNAVRTLERLRKRL